MKNGWYVLYDGSGAKAVDDPAGATYSFVFMKDGKIVRRAIPRDGYTHDFKECMRAELQGMLGALDKPYISEKITKTIEIEVVKG